MSVMLVASIVAGEVGTAVPEARMLVACQVVQDAREGRRVRPPRWNGWRWPTAADVRAAELALFTDACDKLPDCRFLGNDKDVRLWRRMGYVDEHDAVYRISRGRWATNCVMAHPWEEFFERRGGPVPR